MLCAELGGFASESRRSCVARKRGHALQHVVNHLRTDALHVFRRAVFLFDEVAKLRSKLLHGVAAIIQRSNVFGRQAAGNACLFAALAYLCACRDEQLIDRHNGSTEHGLHFLQTQHTHDDGLDALPRIHQAPLTLGQLLLQVAVGHHFGHELRQAALGVFAGDAGIGFNACVQRLQLVDGQLLLFGKRIRVCVS